MAGDQPGGSRYGMAIDTRKCVGCMDCVVACKTENDVPEGFCRDWITYDTTGAFPSPHLEIRSERCNHCDRPPCVACCPTGASHVASPGHLVLVTAGKCIGCKACIASCPYDARFVHPDGYVDKCTFCVHRVEAGQDPACVSVCPTRCMTFGNLNDPASEISRLLASRTHHALKPAAGTEPRIFYLD
ncbi:MAG: 4Fe-4S dicluster domain-containing protein [Bacteroidales bacterium]